MLFSGQSHGFDLSKSLKTFIFCKIKKMGSCFSTSKVTGSNSNTHPAAGVTGNRHRKEGAKQQSTATATATATATGKNRDGSHYNHQKRNSQPQQQRNSQQSKAKRQGGVIPCGKRTDFGYAKDFDKRYTIGKLLGHGQFGYTYVATDKSNGDRVAVKRIEKNKVIFSSFSNWVLFLDFLFPDRRIEKNQLFFSIFPNWVLFL